MTQYNVTISQWYRIGEAGNSSVLMHCTLQHKFRKQIRELTNKECFRLRKKKSNGTKNSNINYHTICSIVTSDYFLQKI